MSFDYKVDVNVSRKILGLCCRICIFVKQFILRDVSLPSFVIKYLMSILVLCCVCVIVANGLIFGEDDCSKVGS